MNYVIFSCNFLPQSDPEAFCTARFANALAATGNHVCVVTPRHNRVVSELICRQILTTDIELCEVDQDGPKSRIIKEFANRTCLREWSTFGVKACINAVREALLRNAGSVLITRASPLQSHIVGFHCRRFARQWIAHFSDPLPWMTPSTFKERAIYRFEHYVVARTLLHANGISITCDQVKQFFGRIFRDIYRLVENKFFVTPHIGEPLLVPQGVVDFGTGDAASIISHCGFLYHGRYSDELINSLNALSKEGLNFYFVQFGGLDISAKDSVKRSSFRIRVIPNADPAATTLLYNQSDVCLVLDTRTEYETSLFLPSKFVYMLFADTPIVIFTPRNSAMHELAMHYPESGIFWADSASERNLNDQIVAALSGSLVVNRERIRARFGITSVASNFQNEIARIDCHD